MAEVGKDTIETTDTLVKKHDEFEKEILEVKQEQEDVVHQRRRLITIYKYSF